MGCTIPMDFSCDEEGCRKTVELDAPVAAPPPTSIRNLVIEVLPLAKLSEDEKQCILQPPWSALLVGWTIDKAGKLRCPQHARPGEP